MSNTENAIVILEWAALVVVIPSFMQYVRTYALGTPDILVGLLCVTASFFLIILFGMSVIADGVDLGD